MRALLVPTLLLGLVGGSTTGLAQGADAGDEIAALFSGVLDAYRGQSLPNVESMRLKDAARFESLMASCLRPGQHPIFADRGVTPERKLQALEPLAGALRRKLEQQPNGERMVGPCTSVLLTLEPTVAAAIWSIVRYETSGQSNGDLVAAYFGSGALGARDFERARRYLQSAGQWRQDTPKRRILILMAAHERGIDLDPDLYEKEAENQKLRAQSMVEALMGGISSPEGQARLQAYPKVCKTDAGWEGLVFGGWDLVSTILAHLYTDGTYEGNDTVGDVAFECLYTSLANGQPETAAAYAKIVLDVFDAGQPHELAAFEFAILHGSGATSSRADFGRVVEHLKSIPAGSDLASVANDLIVLTEILAEVEQQ